MSTTTPSNSSLSVSYNLETNDGHLLLSSRMYNYQTNNLSIIRRKVHSSTIRQKGAAKNDVIVTLETASSSATNNDDSVTSSSTSGDGGSSCSQGIPLDSNIDDEEEEQEEMFVTADPILGHGTIQEWGGPRRGGSLAEPTRFGDWERKGRCTDF